MSNTFTKATDTRNSRQTISELPSLSDDERRLVVEQWNRTSVPFPSTECLHQLFETQAQRTPAACAVEQDGKRISYAELNATANQLAHYLRSSGVRSNDRVAICLGSCPEFLISLLAVLKAGGACVPLDPSYPKQRRKFMLEDVQARTLLTLPEILAEIGPISTPAIALNAVWPFVREQNNQNLRDTCTPDNLAYVIYTSGSTGTPKGVLLGHRGLVNHATAAVELYGLGPADRMLQFSSLSFDIAIEEIFPTWLAGGTVVLKDAGFSLGFQEFSDFVCKQEITALDLPTAYWHEWTNYLFDHRQHPPEKVRLVIVGGEKVSAPALDRWHSLAGRKVRWVNTYGPSEASVIATAYEPASAESGTLSNVPIGRPIANVRVYLLDASLDPVPIGERGELYIGGVGIAQGYLNRPTLTEEKFVSDPFATEPGARLYRTGDMARYRPDGEIEFLGREDDQVKIRGFRVEPGEIEEALGRHAGVREAAVIAHEDESGEKRLAAYVVLADGVRAGESELRAYLSEQLPDYMVPSVVVFLEAMPVTANGKLDRQNLPKPAAHSGAEGEAANETDPLRRRVLKIWQEVLGRRVGPQDNFFESGGHSLLAAKLMHRIGQIMGRPLPLAMLLESPTVERLLRVLRQEGWSRHWSSLVAIQPEGPKPPFFCIHGVGGNVVGFRDLGRHMSPTHPFYGLQACGLDGRQPPFSTIEEMASHYLREIASIQPRGPYFFGGFSLGGLVAYEMAQQLQTQGEEVGLLVLFDTYPGNLNPLTSSLLKSLRTPSKQLLVLLNRSIRRRSRVLWRSLTFPRALREVFQANSRAAGRYRLRPYSGPVTLFRASEQSPRNGDSPYAAWHDLLPAGLEIQDIPGSHNGILVEPEVGVLAQRLKSCMDTVLTRGRALSTP
ncbi:MAG: amino acid adenylation domain-containing protein [Terriglobales bacterium]